MDDPIPHLKGPADQRDDDPPEQQRSSQSNSRGRTNSRGLASPDQIRAALEMLAGLVFTGLVSERKAAMLTRIFESLLRHTKSASNRGVDQMDVNSLRAAFKDYPDMADAFAPF